VLTESKIGLLLNQKPITEEWPWSIDNEVTVDFSIEVAIDEICQKFHLLDKTEYGHYGSGYASFIDCWLYRPDDQFRFDEGNCYWGLVVLFSRLSPYFVIGEGRKTWDEKGASSYLPSFEFVDVLTHKLIRSLERDISLALQLRGWVRAHANQLAEFLPPDIHVPTSLSDPPWRHFDALFYWED
jgi:hypothetical protein